MDMPTIASTPGRVAAPLGEQRYLPGVMTAGLSTRWTTPRAKHVRDLWGQAAVSLARAIDFDEIIRADRRRQERRGTSSTRDVCVRFDLCDNVFISYSISLVSKMNMLSLYVFTRSHPLMLVI